MKKFILLLWISIYLFSFSACGKKEEVPEWSAPSTPKVSENIHIEPSKIPEPSPAPTTTPTTIPTPTPVPLPEPTPVPTPVESLPLPNITKHPHDGTDVLPVGGKTWFIVNADNADGIRWGFLSPDGSALKTLDETMAALPGLELEVLPEYTLALRNVPLEMNGWAVQAEFYNSSGSVFTDIAHVRVADKYSPYEPVFENCRFIMDNLNTHNWDYLWENDTYDLMESHELMGNVNGGICRLGYVLKDLDNNGIDELIIGIMDENWIGPKGGDVIVALFGLDNGEPVRLLYSWPRCLNYLCENGNIYSHGSSGATSHGSDIYEISGATVITKETLWNTLVDEEGNPIYYYSTDGTMEETEAYLATPEIVEDFNARTASCTIPLPELTPIP